MKTAILCLAVLFACGKSSEQQAHEDMDKEVAKHPDLAPAAAAEKPAMKPAAAPVAAAPTPPPPDPTNAADLDKAFKQAMIDGKDKDVLHYCELLKLDEKSSIQSLMGCTLSACRTKNADSAKHYAGLLPSTKDGKALHDQAVKICSTNSVTL
jgi:hypothetical protein